MDQSQRSLLAWARSVLVEANREGSNPAGDARELMEYVLNVTQLWDAPTELNAEQSERFTDLVHRRVAGEPLQHLTGRMYFRYLTLAAQPGVFVARPETEVMVQDAVDWVRGQGMDSPVIVDLCTGSGAIALAVATEVSQARVHAVELSETAFELAVRNRESVGANNVELYLGDATAGEMLAHLNGAVDVVISNPPYIPLAEKVTQTEAQLDPDMALYGGSEDGTAIPIAVMQRALKLLRPDGLFLMEHAQSNAVALADTARGLGFSDVETKVDLTGRPRYLQALAQA